MSIGSRAFVPLVALLLASCGGALDAGSEAPPAAPAPSGDSEAAAAPVKKVLSVSWQGQQRYYWCGPASTRMALSTRTGSPPSQATLAAALGTTVNGTDSIEQVRGVLNRTLGTTWFETKAMNDPPTTAQRDLLKRDILLNIGSGYPIVANVISGWRPPGYPGGTIYHYVAIVGYDQGGDRVLVADPAGACAGGSTWCNVPQTYWISTRDLGTWIGGKGYTA